MSRTAVDPVWVKGLQGGLLIVKALVFIVAYLLWSGEWPWQSVYLTFKIVLITCEQPTAQPFGYLQKYIYFLNSWYCGGTPESSVAHSNNYITSCVSAF